MSKSSDYKRWRQTFLESSSGQWRDQPTSSQDQNQDCNQFRSVLFGDFGFENENYTITLFRQQDDQPLDDQEWVRDFSNFCFERSQKKPGPQELRTPTHPVLAHHNPPQFTRSYPKVVGFSAHKKPPVYHTSCTNIDDAALEVYDKYFIQPSTNSSDRLKMMLNHFL